MVDDKRCTGCSACASVCLRNCISMLPDNQGFLFPQINTDACINCGLCHKVCPVEQKTIEHKEKDIHAFAMINRDSLLRHGSSSGGVFPSIMKHILSQGGSVCGAIYDGQYLVCHEVSENIDDLPKFQSAKYAQSKIGKVFMEIKNALNQGQGRKALFIGTPCQVAGLLSFLKKPYDNLITIDMVCHGVASPAVWKSYLRERTKEDAPYAEISKVNLRDKSTGWSRYSYSVSIQYSNGKQYRRIQSDDAFSRGFTSNLYLRSSCEDCAFKGISRVSDITLGDFWGVWDENPEMDDNAGTSLAIVHSDKGMKIIESIKKEFQIKPVDYKQAFRENKSIYESAERNSKTAEFWTHYFNAGKVCDYLYEMFPTTKISFREKFGVLRRNILVNILKK